MDLNYMLEVVGYFLFNEVAKPEVIQYGFDFCLLTRLEERQTSF